MPDNRVLLIVNSVYHLLTAVHMRHTLLADADADLIITDVTPQLRIVCLACRKLDYSIGCCLPPCRR